MEKIQKELDNLERKATKSNKIVSKGDNMTVRDAIKLGQKGNSIVSTLKKNIKDYESFQPTDAESEKILAQMERILVLTEGHLGLLVANKPRFESLHIGGLVKKNMGKLSETSSEQAKVMLAKTPEHLKPKAQELDVRRSTAFDKAVTAFSKSVGGEDQAEGEDDSD